MKSIEDFLRALIKPGTPLGGLFYGLVGLAVALFWIFLGFWKTLFILILCGLGIFLGGVKDRKEFIKKTINRWFPPKEN